MNIITRIKEVYAYWCYKREYPFVTKNGVRYGIHDPGVLHVDMKSLIRSKGIREQVRACRNIKLEGK